MSQLQTTFAACVAALLCLTSGASAQAPAPRDFPPYDSDLEGLATVSLPALDLDLLEIDDAARETAGEPYRFAVSQRVQIDPWTAGQWQRLAGERLVWRYRVRAARTLSLNLGFDRFELPPSARLRVFAAAGGAEISFTAADNQAHGELWTPLLATGDLVLELTVGEGERSAVRLRLKEINQGYRAFGEDLARKVALGEKSGACNVDVACPQSAGWAAQIRSVAVYSINGRILCTGAMINNTAGDRRPLFLTADHCGITNGNAASVVSYWNYQNSGCRSPGGGASGGPGNGSLGQALTGGAVLRMAYTPSDTTLIEFNNAPDPSWNVYWAGWDRSGRDPVSAVAIHHPNVEEKRISFENDPLTTTAYLSNVADNSKRYFRVADWDVGTTEGGSSGSPLFDDKKRIVGSLTGGFAACGNDQPDWYGRLASAWNGGGGPGSRLSDWLDPSGSGVSILNGLGAGGGGAVPEPPSDLQATALDSSRVRLDWTDNSGDETGFQIFQKTGNGNFSRIVTTAANATTHTVTGLSPATSYTFRVRARNSAGTSAYANEASLTTPAGGGAAPGNLTATSLSASEIDLTWSDAAVGETAYEVRMRGIDTAYQTVATLPANATGHRLTGLAPETIYLFKVRVLTPGGAASTDAVAATTRPLVAPGPCVSDAETLCLRGNRFQARVEWKDQHNGGRRGTGKSLPAPSGDESGFFWFFNSDNVELVVKALDGTSFGGYFWLYYGALSDVEYWLVVTDTETGAVQTYYNAPGSFCGFGDTKAFLPESASASSRPLLLPSAGSRSAPLRAKVELERREGSCVADAETLCLRDGRFQARVNWKNQHAGGVEGTGKAIPNNGSDESGFFWFFDQRNVELVVKVLDATAFSDHYWVFYGALSDVEYELEVVDTVTQESVTYRNAPGNLCGEGDTAALPE